MRTLPASVAIAIIFAGSVLACKVPVFRFALERWETDEYTLVYRDEGSAPAVGKHNLVLRHDPGLTTKFAAHYPDAVGIEAPFWSGDDPAQLVTSPLRQGLLEKIIAGASTVWILIEGSDPAKNDATEQRLKDLLAGAALDLEISAGVVRPEEIEAGEVNLADIDTKDILRSPIPLKIDFQVLRLKHGDEKETGFRQMLLGIHPQLAAVPQEEPILVPVFGRGRMLEGLPASMLNKTTAALASQYLCGECSCEVKEENPGADLLLDADWDNLLEGSYTIIDQQLPPLVGAEEFSSGNLQSPPPTNTQTEAETRATSPTLARNLFVIAVASLGILALASAKFWRPGA